MKNVVLVLMLSLGVTSCAVEQDDAELATDEASLTEKDPGDVSANYFRWQCGANTASLRDAPGGNTIAQINYAEGVEVIGESGAWFYVHRHATGQRGWTLKTYYCP